MFLTDDDNLFQQDNFIMNMWHKNGSWNTQLISRYYITPAPKITSPAAITNKYKLVMGNSAEHSWTDISM